MNAFNDGFKPLWNHLKKCIKKVYGVRFHKRFWEKSSWKIHFQRWFFPKPSLNMHFQKWFWGKPSWRDTFYIRFLTADTFYIRFFYCRCRKFSFFKNIYFILITNPTCNFKQNQTYAYLIIFKLSSIKSNKKQ